MKTKRFHQNFYFSDLTLELKALILGQAGFILTPQCTKHTSYACIIFNTELFTEVKENRGGSSAEPRSCEVTIDHFHRNRGE